MATPPIIITELSSETVVAGGELTFHGKNMAPDHVAHFKPANDSGASAEKVPGHSGSANHVTVTVPHTLSAGEYHVRLATSMGNGITQAHTLTISATSMGNGVTPTMAVVESTTTEAVASTVSDATSMGNGVTH